MRKCVHNLNPAVCAHCIEAGAPRFPPERHQRMAPRRLDAAEIKAEEEKDARLDAAAGALMSKGVRAVPAPVAVVVEAASQAAPEAPAPAKSSSSQSSSRSSAASSSPASGTCRFCGLPSKGHTPAACAVAQAKSGGRKCARCPGVNTRSLDSTLPDFCRTCHGNATKRARLALRRSDVTDAEVLAELAKPYDAQSAHRGPRESKKTKARKGDGPRPRAAVPASAPPVENPTSPYRKVVCVADGVEYRGTTFARAPGPADAMEGVTIDRIHDGAEGRPEKQRPAVATPEPAPLPKGEPVTPTLIRWLRTLPAAPEIIDPVVRAVEARAAFGLEKYGQPLMTGDGRDSVNDAQQEAVDLLQYTMKAHMNGESLDPLRTVLAAVSHLVGSDPGHVVNVPVDVRLPPVILGMLDTLMVSGLWGTTRAAVLERLTCERLRDLARDGLLVLR